MTRVAIFSPHREFNGDTHAMPLLASALASRGYHVDLLRSWEEWDGTGLSDGVRIVDLGTKHFAPLLPNVERVSKMASYRLEMATIGVAMMPGFVGYLRRYRPDVLIARMLTVPATIGTTLARVRTKLILASGGLPHASLFRRFVWPKVHPRADCFVASATDVATAASQITGVPRSTYHVIHEAVIGDHALTLAVEPLEHPWFHDGAIPVVVAVGRLTKQKDYPTMLRAFAKLRSQQPARLLILGEGELRSSLEALAQELNIDDDVKMPGFESNPYKYLRAADAFVLSSLWEGSSHALIEAQAMGTAAVSTDCPAGQRDTLLDGQAGLLVPVGDVDAMAAAMGKLINDRGEAKRLVEIGLKSSHRFRLESVATEWEDLIEMLVHGSSQGSRN